MIKYDRLSSQGIVYGLSVPAFMCCCAAAFITGIAVIGQGLIGLLTVAPVVIFLGVLGFVKIHSEALVTHFLREVVGMVRKMTGATKYVARPDAEVNTNPVLSLNIPGKQGRIFVYETTGGACVVWDALAQTATISCMVVTPGLGVPVNDAISTVSDQERETYIDEWGKVIGSLTQKSHIKRVAMLEQTRPGTVTGAQMFAQDNIQNPESPAAKSYLQQVNSLKTTTHVTLVTITFNLTGEVNGLIKASKSKKAGMLGVAELEMQTFTDALYNAGFQKVRWLSAREWGGWGRSIIDPLSQHYVDARAYTQLEGVDPHAATPMLLDEKRNSVESDSAWHRTYWINEWPRYETHPGFMSRLVFAKQHTGEPVRHTFMLVCTPVQIGKALKDIDDAKRTWNTNDMLKHKTGKPTSAMDMADLQNIFDHEEELVKGQGEFRFTAYLTVTSVNKDSLEKESASLLNALSATGLEPRMIPWQQGEALMNVAYPCGLGMK